MFFVSLFSALIQDRYRVIKTENGTEKFSIFIRKQQRRAFLTEGKRFVIKTLVSRRVSFINEHSNESRQIGRKFAEWAIEAQAINIRSNGVTFYEISCFFVHFTSKIWMEMKRVLWGSLWWKRRFMGELKNDVMEIPHFPSRNRHQASLRYAPTRLNVGQTCFWKRKSNKYPGV